jgi:hypothetical protein
MTELVLVMNTILMDVTDSMDYRLNYLPALGIVLGLALGTASSALGETTATVAIMSALGTAFVAVFGFVRLVSVVSGGTVGFTVAFFVGVLQAIRYPIYLVLAFRSAFGEKTHPLEWDELIVLPLPCTCRVLTQRLDAGELDGLRFVVSVARNSFQRWAAQRALQFHLHDQSSSVRFLYLLLAWPELDEFIYPPAGGNSWTIRPSARKLLLGELAQRSVRCHSGLIDASLDRFVELVTGVFRDRRATPLTQFAGALYDLLDRERVDRDGFDLVTHAEAYTGLSSYPDGVEIAHTFAAMAEFLTYDDLLDLPAAVGQNAILYYDNPIRPTLLTALACLGQVGAEVTAYRDATSRVNQLAALARATDALDGLDEYAVTEVIAPEQYILRRIIRQWRRLVSEAGGEAGRLVEAEPVSNPYVAGNPVEGNLFIGREDVMRRLEELWIGEGQKPSVVLYGHRRMGKSSILHNLGARFGLDTVIVDFNMQRVGLVESAGELLYNLALALYDSLPNLQEGVGEPDAARFADHNPYTAFDRFLRQIDRVRDDRRFIVTVDEFELIERAIEENQLEARLLDFWRGLIQTYPWFVMVFAGLHTLQEMTRDYWHPLYGSVTPIPVSFLSHEASRRLITQPTPEFSLDYDRDAVESIIALTNGQPYLVQLIGHGLVTRFNRQTFEEGIERERRFSLVDVEAVINAPEFYRDGDAYFTGVWRQAETSEPPGQTAVLHAMVQSEKGAPIDVIARRAALVPEKVAQALQALARHDVVAGAAGQWQFTVELMRRWVAQR